MGNSDNSKIVDAIGMPDAGDRENIRRLITKYDREHPGENAEAVAAARWELSSGLVDSSVGDYNVKSKDSDLRHLGTMSPGFAKELEEGYPGIFRYPEHTIWFFKNFPEFRVAGKI